MKKFTVEFDGSWIFKHRDDDVLPVSWVEAELKKSDLLESHEASLTELTVLFDEQKTEKETIEQSIRKILSKKYPREDFADVLTFRSEDFAASETDLSAKEEFEEERTTLQAENGNAVETSGKESPAQPCEREDVSSAIDALVGASEFKRLAKEIEAVAVEIKRTGTSEIFKNRCYLFSIGDGYGLTTYLELLAKLIDKTGLCPMYHSVREERLGAYRDGPEPFEAVMNALDFGDKDKLKVLCVDISEWMDETDNRFFKRFLRKVEKHAEEFIVVFRIPFVDKNLFARVRYSLSDLLSIVPVSFPPLQQAELKECAEREFRRFGFSLTKAAWECFFACIAEEKRDGKFYGINTLKKIVRDFVYQKQLNNLQGKKSKTISERDVKALCENTDASNLPGIRQLESLVGHENLKKQLDEIIAQIEFSVKNAEERPCIHMSFVGNPGTGKTTVARIFGKILKEKGVLRVGNFYECCGRDLCGRYIGETAPKTASICRDAYGSVLFIDEAYSLYRGAGDDKDYGREAIDTLVAEMENHRNDFVVILAGYTDDMKKMMKGNIGLASRVPYTIEFPNFTREQLYRIFVSMAERKFECDKQLFDAAQDYFDTLSDDVLAAKEFANARFVRNLFERTWAKAAMRCQLAGEERIVLRKEDFEQAIADREFLNQVAKKTGMGFMI